MSDGDRGIGPPPDRISPQWTPARSQVIRIDRFAIPLREHEPVSCQMVPAASRSSSWLSQCSSSASTQTRISGKVCSDRTNPDRPPLAQPVGGVMARVDRRTSPTSSVSGPSPNRAAAIETGVRGVSSRRWWAEPGACPGSDAARRNLADRISRRYSQDREEGDAYGQEPTESGTTCCVGST